MRKTAKYCTLKYQSLVYFNQQTAMQILDLNRQIDTALVVVTRDLAIAERM